LTGARALKFKLSHYPEIIELDMGMSAKVLQLVNSAFFGLAQTVTTLQHAASYLGMETIKKSGFGFRDLQGFCA
jgi:HD-like signal output (HDOD) protein